MKRKQNLNGLGKSCSSYPFLLHYETFACAAFLFSSKTLSLYTVVWPRGYLGFAFLESLQVMLYRRLQNFCRTLPWWLVVKHLSQRCMSNSENLFFCHLHMYFLPWGYSLCTESYTIVQFCSSWTTFSSFVSGTNCVTDSPGLWVI